MKNRFLEICGPLELSGDGTASGVLCLGMYRGRMQVAPGILLLEGIHQCAVRLGRTVIPGGRVKGARVLPVAVKSFVQRESVLADDYMFHCRATPFGNSARISVHVFRHGRKSLADAEIHVALL